MFLIILNRVPVKKIKLKKKIAVFQIFLNIFFKNSKKISILNYPKSCAGKKKFNKKKNCSVLNCSKIFFLKIQKKISILNYPKSCAGKKKLNYSKNVFKNSKRF